MFKANFKRFSPLAGRTEPAATSAVQMTTKYRVNVSAKKYLDESLLKQGLRGTKQFARLTKQDKREWREGLQRHINSLKSRLAARALSGVTPRGKTAYRMNRLTRLEAALIDNMREADEEPVELQGFGKAAVNISLAAAGVSVAVVAKKAHDTLKSVNNMMDDGAPTVKSTVDGVGAFVDAITHFVDAIKHVGAFLWKPALMILGIWLLTKYAHVSILTAAICSAVGAYIPEITDLFKKFLPDALKFQDGGLSMASDVIAMVCTCWVPGKDTKSVTGEFMKRASNFPRASDGIESFMKKALSLIEQFLNFILKRDDESRITLTGKLNAFDAWRKEAVEKITYATKHPTMPIEEIRKIKDIQIRGLGFHQVLATVESKRELNFWLEKLALTLAPHEGAINAENNMRPMPSCIMLGGGSGVGKTTMVRYIASMILVLSGDCTLSNALDNLWQKGSTEYWNGYIGQKCLVMDDCFQVKGKPGDMDSEAMQMIRGIGNWSYPLNFADLSSKGKIYLDTPLVVGTTNCKNVQAEWAPFITEPLALTRRFQTSCWVTLNPEYKDEDGRFAYDRVNKLFHDVIVDLAAQADKIKAEGGVMSVDQVMDAMPWNIWNLHPHKFDRTDISEAVMPGGLRAVIENTAREMKLRKQANREEIKDISSLLGILTEAMEVEAQAGVQHVVRYVSDDLNPVQSFDLESPHLEEEYPMPECEIIPDDALSFLDKQGTNLTRAQAWYQAMACESRYENFIYLLRCQYIMWKKLILGNTKNWGFPRVIMESMKLGMFLSITFKVVKALVLGAVNLLNVVISFVLGLFGGKAKEEPREKEEVKHIDIATYNSLGPLNTQVGVPPEEHVHENIYCNTLKCATPDADVGQFIGLGSDVYMFPKHYLNSLRTISQDIVLTFVSAKDGARGTLTVGDFLGLRIVEVPKYDVAAVAFGRVFFKACKNIVGHFLAQHEIKTIFRGSNVGVRLDVASFNKEGKLKQRTMYSPTCMYHGKAVASGSTEPLNGLARYTAPTVAGDCGAPLTIAENRHFGGRCILGFHSAGRDNIHGREGYSTLVSQEVARELYMQLYSYHDDLVTLETYGISELHGTERVEVQDALNTRGLTTGSFELIGVLNKPVHVPTKTSLKLSTCGRDEIFGPCPVAPAVLKSKYTDGVVIDPMIQGLKAYQTDLTCKSPKDLEPVVDLAMQKHWEATQHHPRSILTFEEAVVGVEGWKLKPINRKTSPGHRYRYYVTSKQPGKTAFFGNEDNFVLNDPNNEALQDLRQDVDTIIANAECGVRTLHLCTDFLKDELRPLAKVEAVATRVISATELDYTIAVRMYFGAFLAAMFDTYVANGMAPGINQYTQWFALAEALRSRGSKYFDGDFSRFDASEQPWIHEGMLGYVNRWYRYNNPEWEPRHDKIRGILWLDLVHSRHVTGFGNTLSFVVQWTKSLPSGHPLTTMVNSMYSLITLTGCYIILTGDATNMWKHAYIVTFGDDNLTAVDDLICEIFNQVTVAKCMRDHFGLTYTPGNKSGVLVPYTHLEDVTFLKRSFRVDDSIINRLLTTCPEPLGWVGPLDISSFLYIPYWYKNSRTPTEEIITRIEQMLCELSLHTEATWDKYYPTIATWCTENNVPLSYTSRAVTRTFVAQRMDVWF